MRRGPTPVLAAKSQATATRGRGKARRFADRVTEQPRLGRRWLTLATLCTAVLIAQVDTSVVNLGIRPIGQYFHAEIGALQWVSDSYNLVYAAFLLSGGLLADLYGRRLVFMAGTAVFALASLLSALAPTVAILIGGRALAGVGAALLLPASLAIIRVVWPDPRVRGKVLGIWAGCNGLAFAIGPTLGGVLIEHFGWRSIFLAVLPLALAALILAAICIPRSADPRGRHFDALGQALGALVLGALAAAAIEWRHTLVVAVAILPCAGLALMLFVALEAARGDAALIPLGMFRLREFRGAMTATAGMTFGMYGIVFLLPLFWQSSGTLNPMAAGLALMPMALVFVLVSSLSGLLGIWLGTRTMSAAGVALIGSGLLVVGITAASGSLISMELGLVLTGLGMGVATGPLMGAAVGAVSAARSGTAASLINVARMIGATLGVAVLGTVFASAGSGAAGLGRAMYIGGSVQLAAALAAWVAMRPAPEPQ